MNELTVVAAKTVQIPACNRKYRTRAARVHFSPKGESIFENLLNRHSRPHKLYRKVLVDALIAAGGKPEEAAEAAENARWSQKAGCSCGCSPAFILKDVFNVDIFVDVVETQHTL